MEKITSFTIDHTRLFPGVYVSSPMGCRTGFYLLIKGDWESKDIHELLLSCFSFIVEYEGDIPGQTEHDCGNFRDMNLPVAKWWGKKYCDEVLKKFSFENTHYPA
mgnify:CR=1 FL=1